MKKTKILIPAMSVLALGMAASVAGTVAWFYTNDVANATGMAVKTHVPSSLYIEKGFYAKNGGDNLYRDAIEYTELASEINECHMGTLNLNDDSAAKLEGLTPLTWETNTSQDQAGAASSYQVASQLALSSSGEGDAATPVFGASTFANRALILDQSIIRKTNGSGTFDLQASVTITGIDGRIQTAPIANGGHTLYEHTAINALRVGFLATKDGGLTWAFVGQQQSTNYSSVVAASEGHVSPYYPDVSGMTENTNQSATIYGSPIEVLASCPNNTVIGVAPVIWIEGSDPACTALKFQNQYNWTISVSYSITNASALGA